LIQSNEGEPIDLQEKDASSFGFFQRLNTANLVKPLGHAKLAGALRCITDQAFARRLHNQKNVDSQLGDMESLGRRDARNCAGIKRPSPEPGGVARD